MAAAAGLLVLAAAAQTSEPASNAKVQAETHANVMVRTMSAFRGQTVKGAPYSGEEVNETNQVLADGTRIHRENRTTVYRDSEGRTRRESPDSITIADPVANVTYLLDPKAMTGQKLAMSGPHLSVPTSFGVARSAPGANGSFSASTITMTSSGDGPTRIIVNGQPLDEKAVAEAMAKAKVSGAAQTIVHEARAATTILGGGEGGGGMAFYNPSSGIGPDFDVAYSVENGATTLASVGIPARKVAAEPLGKRTIEGITADGQRITSTIAAGAIGNDRPIQITNETWRSDELKMVVMSKRSDPRTGEESFRLININRGEPAAYLFQAPAGYQINERK
jgi:hypothetical protein